MAALKKKVIPALIRWLVASFVCFAPAAFADAPRYKLVDIDSTLTFTAVQNNAPVTGSFAGFTVDIAFDPQQLDSSNIHVEVYISSLTMGDSNMIETLKMPEWLSAEAFPKAVFDSTLIQKAGGKDQYMAKGQLTLKNHTQPLTLYFKMVHMDEVSAIADGYATIMRDNFAVGEGEWASVDSVKNDVRVNFHIVANKVSTTNNP
jgi:polyisoprenoid-binding protein YceI